MLYHEKSLTQLRQLLDNRSVSSVELTQYFLDRIAKFNPSLNAFITVTAEHALTQAKAADERIQAGTAGPLTGIPLAQKDIFCTKGIKTTCGSKMLDNFIAPYDATIIERFNAAGAVMLGKLNMDEFAMGSSNENSFYGPVHNPWDLARIPGGSSGGSAAAMAAGLAAGVTGTDTGGSIRQPAALCGITGIKPTYGRVSRYGMIAFASSLDQAGPMTPSAEDSALLLQVMAGHDPRDSTSINRPVPNYQTEIKQSLNGLRIGLPKEYWNDALNPQIAACLLEVKKTLEGLGVEFKEISLPHTQYAVPAYYVLAPAECSSNLARYDGVRYGYRCQDPKDLQDLYERSRSEGFGNEVKRRILIGTYVLSAGYYDAHYKQAQKIRYLMRQDFINAFKEVDAILAPTTPSTAFKLGDKIQDPVTMYLSDIYTIAANLAGLPALSMPAGFVDNLAVGAQLIGNYFDEGRLLGIAHQYQQMTDWHLRRPAL